MPYLFFSIALASSLALLLKITLRRPKPLIKDMDGPEPSGWLLGNMQSLHRQENVGDVDAEYIKQYGLAFKLKGVFSRDLLYLADPKGLHYVFDTSGYIFHKRNTAKMFRMLMGPAIIALTGEDHARLRKIMQPGFSRNAMKAFVPVFFQVTQKLVGKWRDLLQEGQGSMTVDIHTWLSNLTLDAVGEGVLSHDFGALSDTPGEFARAYKNLFVDMFHQPSDARLVISSFFLNLPAWIFSMLESVLFRAVKRLSEFRAISTNLASEIVKRETEALAGGLPQGKDIMSSLLRANMSETAKNRLSTEELLAQLSPLTVAGHDTTTNTIVWLFYELSRHPEVQNKLREEINATQAATASNELSLNDFDSMPYTTAVIKETLRYYPIAAYNARCADRDELIPLSRPIKTNTGEEISAIPVKKGQVILSSIWGYNRIKELWGEDADQWNPERFMGENLKLRPHNSFGVYASLATFSGGVHSCIGWRFAVLELQIILVTLIQYFEFSPAPHNPVMRQVMAPTLVPMVKGEEDQGVQMPMTISFVN